LWDWHRLLPVDHPRLLELTWFKDSVVILFIVLQSSQDMHMYQRIVAPVRANAQLADVLKHFLLQAWLAGGDWHRLLPADHPGLSEVKWCMNRFVPFLVVDPHPDLNPGSRDAEEASMEVRQRLRAWCWCCFQMEHCML
jgi:hypothetical protein